MSARTYAYACRLGLPGRGDGVSWQLTAGSLSEALAAAEALAAEQGAPAHAERETMRIGDRRAIACRADGVRVLTVTLADPEAAS